MIGKRVMLIIPEMAMGGAQRSISKLSLELAKHHFVWLVIFNRDHTIAYEHGGELLSLDVIPGPGPLDKLIALIRRVKRLKKLKRELNVDASISFLEGADYINVLTRSTERVVLSVRGSKQYDETIRGRFSWLRNKILIPWLYPKADVIVTVNHGIAAELTDHYGLNESKIMVIGNYYNIQDIIDLSNEPKNSLITRLYHDPVLITTGRLAQEKGLKNLIYVFKGLKNKFGNLRLVMIGDGPEFDPLALTIRSLGLGMHVGSDYEILPDILILKDQKNVFKFLRGASIYLMNSSSEGFPNGLAEAMICDVPVISSDCPYGPREILEPKYPFPLELSKPHNSPNGILMPTIRSDYDLQLWIETISSLLEKRDELLLMARNARQRVALFDHELMIREWDKVL